MIAMFNDTKFNQFTSQTSLNFDDVHIVTSKEGVVASREEVKFNNNKIIIAPMSAIQNSEFNKECVRLGLSLPVHRFCSIDEQTILMQEAVEEAEIYKSQSNLWLSVGLKDWKDRFNSVKKLLSRREFNILLDVAYCDNVHVIETIKEIKKFTDLKVFSGNVHSKPSFVRMSEHCSAVRVGIGGGSVCVTTDNTGIGRGQLTSVLDCAANRDLQNHTWVVSDGAIRKPGDVAKAFGAGADAVMIGGMFASAVESEAHQTGVMYGGASSVAKKLANNKDNRYIEGAVVKIDNTGSKALASIVQEIIDGVRSCISYCGYDSIHSFIGNAVFEKK